MKKANKTRVLQKVLALALVLVTSALLSASVAPPKQGEQVQAASKKSAALKAYRKELSKKKSRIGYGQAAYFYVQDVDGDKIPELIMFFSASSHVSLCTYKNGKVKSLVEAKYGLDIYPKKHVVMWTYATGNNPCDYWYKISNGKAKLVAYKSKHLVDWSSQRYSEKYKINRKKVSKKKYNRYIKKIGKKSNYTVIENTKVNRDQYLGS